jgi:hypothetical protein
VPPGGILSPGRVQDQKGHCQNAGNACGDSVHSSTV